MPQNRLPSLDAQIPIELGQPLQLVARNHLVSNRKMTPSSNANSKLNTASAEVPELLCSVDVPSERLFHVGKGVALCLQGWAFCPGETIERLYILDGTARHEIYNHSWPRQDVLDYFYPARDTHGTSLFSGYNVIIPIEEVLAEQEREFVLCANLKSGGVVRQNLGAFRFLPGNGRRDSNVRWPHEGPKVAICMATHNPDRELLQRQIESIIAQDHKNWVCIITDDSSNDVSSHNILDLVENDARFYYSKNKERKGFYRNFEESLSQVPPDAEFVALCDQDDSWDANKLSTLLNAIDEKHQLVFSDCRIVMNDEVVSGTFWATRQNHYRSFKDTFTANVVTGAASMFRASLLPFVLPFPQKVFEVYHDQWIALAAHLRGGISYVEQPLYSYHQHPDNVIGHKEAHRFGGIRHSVQQVINASTNRRRLLETVRNLASQATWNFPDLLQKAIFGATLKLRCKGLGKDDQKVVNQFSKLSTHLTSPGLLKLLSVLQGKQSTLNVEGYFLNTAVGIRARNVLYKIGKKRFLARALGAPAITAGVATQVAGTPDVEDVASGWIFHNVRPLKLRISRREPKRVNMLLATIDFKYIFGGYIGMFNLALRLRREGFVVRIVTLEYTELDVGLARERLRGYPGVESLFDDVEVVHRYNREEELVVNPDDRFVATNCWGGHVAHHASRELGHNQFLFMVQEYEPFFLPMNTASALFQQSYTFPQFQLFSTPLLRDYFRIHKIGVFSQSDGKLHHAVFKNAIQKFAPLLDDLRHRERRILFYARPEAHAARNLFELGLMSLAKLARSPAFDSERWSFFGMGSIGGASKVKLAPGVFLEMMPKTDLQTYTERLPRHDVGLSLMLTPHPSLVPLEMASAGMWAVTNTFENKTEESLKAISTNLIAVEPTLDGIVRGLGVAIAKADDLEARIAGAQIDWPTDWKDAFEPSAIKKIIDFLS